MIRSSSHTLKYTNTTKKNQLNIFIQQYQSMVQKYINILWNQYKNNPPKLLNNEIYQSIQTNINYDSRIKQCAAKQACSMIQAITNKQNKRKYKLKQLQKEGKDTKYLQRKIDLFNPKKPNTNNINVELDSRFVNFRSGKHFDLFIKISQIGNKRTINLPIKHTKVSNKWKKEGKLRPSIRLTNNKIVLFYEIEKRTNNGTKVLGADQGMLTCLSLSDGQITKLNKHNYDLNKIQNVLTRRKKGSKRFRKAQEHRKNYINWSINQLNFSNVKEVRLEKIRNIRKGKKNSRKLTHWTYTLIKNKLIMFGEEKGFLVSEQDNKFRSQRCSKCGWTHKSNRLGKTFRCRHCEFCTDSDLNAACNHEIELIELNWSIWYNRNNRLTGFYWLVDEVIL